MQLPRENSFQARVMRIFGLVIFTFIPIISFVCGFYYQKNASIQRKNVSKVPTPTMQNKTDAFIQSLTLHLPFNNEVVLLNRMGSGKVEGTFWNSKAIVIPDEDSALNEDQIVQKIYGSNSPAGLYYLGWGKNEYVELLPGFYRTLTITTGIPLLPNDTNKTDCNNEHIKASSRSAIRQTCTTTTINPDNQNQIIRDVIKNCFLPLPNNRYLAYIQKGNSIDGNFDLCTELENMGIQEWNIQKN